MHRKPESDPCVDPRIKKGFAATAGGLRPDVASRTVSIRCIRPEGDAILPGIHYIHGGRMQFSVCYQGNYKTWGRMMAARGVAVAGESGGGNLSLAVGMALRQRGALSLIKGIDALCPCISGRWPQAKYPSWIENEGIGFYFQDNRATVACGIEAFNAGNPLAWPSFATRADVAEFTIN